MTRQLTRDPDAGTTWSELSNSIQKCRDALSNPYLDFEFAPDVGITCLRRIEQCLYKWESLNNQRTKSSIPENREFRRLGNILRKVTQTCAFDDKKSTLLQMRDGLAEAEQLVRTTNVRDLPLNVLRFPFESVRVQNQVRGSSRKAQLLDFEAHCHQSVLSETASPRGDNGMDDSAQALRDLIETHRKNVRDLISYIPRRPIDTSILRQLEDERESIADTKAKLAEIGIEIDDDIVDHEDLFNQSQTGSSSHHSFSRSRDRESIRSVERKKNHSIHSETRAEPIDIQYVIEKVKTYREAFVDQSLDLNSQSDLRENIQTRFEELLLIVENLMQNPVRGTTSNTSIFLDRLANNLRYCVELLAGLSKDKNTSAIIYRLLDETLELLDP